MDDRYRSDRDWRDRENNRSEGRDRGEHNYGRGDEMSGRDFMTNQPRAGESHDRDRWRDTGREQTDWDQRPRMTYTERWSTEHRGDEGSNRDWDRGERGSQYGGQFANQYGNQYGGQYGGPYGSQYGRDREDVGQGWTRDRDQSRNMQSSWSREDRNWNRDERNMMGRSDYGNQNYRGREQSWNSMERGQYTEPSSYFDRDRSGWPNRDLNEHRGYNSPDYGTQRFESTRYPYGRQHEQRDRWYSGHEENRGRDESLTERVGRFFGMGPKGYRRSDERIREDVSERLEDHPEIDASNIEIQVKDGEVTLSGSVDNRRAKRLAEDVAENCRGVRDVHNQIRVTSESQTITPTTTRDRKSAA